MQGKAIASDATYAGFWTSGTAWDIGGSYFLTSLNHMALNYVWSNHDSAYNVLFGDGAVKTFADSGHALYKYFVERKMGHVNSSRTNAKPYNATTKEVHDGVWVPYFDELYAQD